jgi:hypothetical protein
MSEEDFNYFQRRANEERVAAQRASDIVAARIHEHLAASYAALVKAKSQDTADSGTVRAD